MTIPIHFNTLSLLVDPITLKTGRILPGISNDNYQDFRSTIKTIPLSVLNP